MTIPAIAEEYQIKEITIINHLENYLRDGYNISRIPGREDNFPEGIEAEKAKQLFRELGTDLLKPVFEALAGELEYDLLRKIRIVCLLEKGNL
jgi:hypothetical protein